MSRKIKLAIKNSSCRSGFHVVGDEYIINEDCTVCPPICMELWHYAYPYVWTLLNGGILDDGDIILYVSEGVNKCVSNRRGQIDGVSEKYANERSKEIIDNDINR